MDSAIQMISEKALKTAARYQGEKASGYDESRSGTAKWHGEDRAVRSFFEGKRPGFRVLDIPCGTGRFFELYAEKGFVALGMDISEQMLAQARKHDVPCRMGNIFDIDLPDGSVDIALSIRFMNLIEASDMAIALGELQRVARKMVVFTLRVRSKNPTAHYHSPRSLEEVAAALRPGWRLAGSDPIHEDDYRMVRLCNG